MSGQAIVAPAAQTPNATESVSTCTAAYAQRGRRNTNPMAAVELRSVSCEKYSNSWGSSCGSLVMSFNIAEDCPLRACSLKSSESWPAGGRTGEQLGLAPQLPCQRGQRERRDDQPELARGTEQVVRGHDAEPSDDGRHAHRQVRNQEDDGQHASAGVRRRVRNQIANRALKPGAEAGARHGSAE